MKRMFQAEQNMVIHQKHFFSMVPTYGEYCSPSRNRQLYDDLLTVSLKVQKNQGEEGASKIALQIPADGHPDRGKKGVALATCCETGVLQTVTYILLCNFLKDGGNERSNFDTLHRLWMYFRDLCVRDMSHLLFEYDELGNNGFTMYI